MTRQALAWVSLAHGVLGALIVKEQQVTESCSCDLCNPVWQPEVHFIARSGAVKQKFTPAALQCASTSHSEACLGFCSENCSPAMLGFSNKVVTQERATSKLALSTQVGPKSPALPKCQLSTTHAPAEAAKGLALALMEVRKHHSERALQRAGCPPPQKCNCWCDCPEILFGQPPPPGVPPITAVNPYAPPPPAPMPPPPPFFVGPPPMQAAPFNPMAPAAFLQQQNKQGSAATAVASQPCRGPECRPPSGCPPSMPCNCYCACRPPVPTKKQAFEGR